MVSFYRTKTRPISLGLGRSLDGHVRCGLHFHEGGAHQLGVAEYFGVQRCQLKKVNQRTYHDERQRNQG